MVLMYLLLWSYKMKALSCKRLLKGAIWFNPSLMLVNVVLVLLYLLCCYVVPVMLLLLLSCLLPSQPSSKPSLPWYVMLLIAEQQKTGENMMKHDKLRWHVTRQNDKMSQLRILLFAIIFSSSPNSSLLGKLQFLLKRFIIEIHKICFWYNFCGSFADEQTLLKMSEAGIRKRLKKEKERKQNNKMFWVSADPP